MKKKDIILISLDTLRADVAYSGKFKTIEQLRSSGVSFLNTISSAPLTPVSHASVFTGLQPYNHGIRHLFKEKISKKVSTLAEVLKKNGYVTSAVVSCPGMNSWYGFSRGFDNYDDEIPRLADGSNALDTVDVKKRGTALKRANLVVERAIKLLEKKKKQPMFMFLHFFDAHWPYEAPEKFGGDNYYEEEVAFSDHYLGFFIEELKRKKLFDDAIIVLFSDHGEDLEGLYPNDKGGKKLGHPEECGHGCLLYEQTQKVVLLIKSSEFPKKKNISQQVRLIDIMPTVLDLAKIKNEINFDGVSLLPIISKNAKLNLPGYSETFYPEEQTAATGKYKNTRNLKSMRFENKDKVIWQESGDKIETYNLIIDPLENNNLS